jgi:hypothetical protein
MAAQELAGHKGGIMMYDVRCGISVASKVCLLREMS